MVVYLILAARLREELENLEQVIAVAQRSITRAERQPVDSELYINSAALSLHSFYVGVERMFLAIAEELDQQAPTGPSWHLDLLNQMTYDLPTVRPPVLATATRDMLDEYRSFRHVVRNVYTYNLNPDRVRQLVDNLPNVFATTQTDIDHFLEFLDIAGRTPVDNEN